MSITVYMRVNRRGVRLVDDECDGRRREWVCRIELKLERKDLALVQAVAQDFDREQPRLHVFCGKKTQPFGEALRLDLSEFLVEASQIHSGGHGARIQTVIVVSV